MAARENQGYLIAVIILVLLVLVLALAAFLGISKAGENATSKIAVEHKLLLAKTLSDAQGIESNIIKALLGGFGPTVAEVPTQIDSLGRLAATRGLEASEQAQIQAIVERVKEIKAAYDKDMRGNVSPEEANEPTWRDTIRTLTGLIATKNKENRIQVNQTALSEKEAASKIANMQSTLATAQKALKDLQNELAAEKRRGLEKENELKGKLDEAVAGNEAVNQRLQVVQQNSTTTIRGLENSIALVEEQNAILKTRINRYEKEVFDHPDGKIVQVASALRTVFIDLGSEDGLTNNQTFTIYDQGVTNFEKDQHKAMVEVTRVHPFRAEARITDEDPTNPILTGDFVLTATWDPGFSVPIAIAGIFDLDGDIYDDREKLVQMIERNGGKVIAKHDDDGNIEGVIDANTRFLVVGDPPSLTADANETQKRNSTAVNVAMQQMQAMAEKNTVQVIGLQKLLNRMGVRAKPKTLQIEKRFGEFPARSPGSSTRGSTSEGSTTRGSTTRGSTSEGSTTRGSSSK